MSFYHCPLVVLEHPTLLVDALRAHGVRSEFDSSARKAVAHVGTEIACVVMHPNRFRHNLSLRDYSLRLPPSLTVERTICPIFADLGMVEVEHPTEEELAFIEKSFKQTRTMKSLIHEIRRLNQLKWQMVEIQDYEQAVVYRDEQQPVLDRLHDHCITGIRG